MKLVNLEIRTLMEKKRIKGYEVAAAIGISETSFSRMLCRGELSEEKKRRLLQQSKTFLINFFNRKLPHGNFVNIWR